MTELCTKNPDEEILEVSLDVNPDGMDHDMVCVMQAGKLMEIGYLEYEIAAYATAVSDGGVVRYYLTKNEFAIDRLIEDLYRQGKFPTPRAYYVKRFDLVNTTKGEIEQQFYQDIFTDLQNTYSADFFRKLEQIHPVDASNRYFVVMTQIMDQIEDSFDELKLKLFQDLLSRLVKGHLLNEEQYTLLSIRLESAYKKIEVEPIASGKYSKTFAGFAYQMEPGGAVKYFIDAVPHLARERLNLYLAKGYTVTPLFEKNYYAISFQQLLGAKQAFQKDIKDYLESSYVPLMQYLKTLPASVVEEEYRKFYGEIEASGSEKAMEAYRYFGSLWNVL